MAQGSEWWLLALNVTTVFLLMWACHGELAGDRPPARHLTEYYLLLSLGGVLGGSFNALLAPVLFNSVWEYPLALAAACLLRPVAAASSPSARLLDLFLPALLAVAIVGLTWWFGARNENESLAQFNRMIILGAPALVCYTFADRPLRLALGVAALLLVSFANELFFEPVLHSQRSFFGVHRVTFDPEHDVHRLVHGTTLHGWQSQRPELRRTPTSYYHRSGPLGQVFQHYGEDPGKKQVAIIGLGSGGVAPYCRGHHFTFFEIDPAVQQIAENPGLFTYLSDLGKDHYRIVLGDGRLTLAEAQGKFGIFFLDAFTSDSIPVHLLTSQALQIYLSKLEDGGLLVFNISSRFFKLEDLVGGLATRTRRRANHPPSSRSWLGDPKTPLN
jgi:hypothetical protein